MEQSQQKQKHNKNPYICKYHNVFDGQIRTFEEKQKIISTMDRKVINKLLKTISLQNILTQDNLDQLESYLLMLKKISNTFLEKVENHICLIQNKILIGYHENQKDSNMNKRLCHIFCFLVNDINSYNSVELQINRALLLLPIVAKTVHERVMDDMVGASNIFSYASYEFNAIEKIKLIELTSPIVNIIFQAKYRNISYQDDFMINCLTILCADNIEYNELFVNEFSAMLKRVDWSPVHKREFITMIFFGRINNYNEKVRKNKKLNFDSTALLMDKNGNFYVKSILDVQPEELLMESMVNISCKDSSNLHRRPGLLYMSFFDVHNSAFLKAGIKQDFVNAFERGLLTNNIKLPNNHMSRALNNFKIIKESDKLKSMDIFRKVGKHLIDNSKYKLYLFMASDLYNEVL